MPAFRYDIIKDGRVIKSEFSERIAKFWFKHLGADEIKTICIL
jgi:hypothetical protein